MNCAVLVLTYVGHVSGPAKRSPGADWGRAMVAFCVRDALGSSAALAGARPKFHDRYCRDISISRVTASQAYRDGRRQGDIPPSVGAEKTWQEGIFAAFRSGPDPIGAYGHMVRYLQRRELPVGPGNEGGTVVVVDFACGNGTAQESAVTRRRLLKAERQVRPTSSTSPPTSSTSAPAPDQPGDRDVLTTHTGPRRRRTTADLRALPRAACRARQDRLASSAGTPTAAGSVYVARA